MTQPNDEPRWLRLAARSRAEADPALLTRVRARLAACAAEPAWVRWLARPVALALSASLLVASAIMGGMLLQQDRTPASAQDSMALGVGDLLGEDGSYGLTFDAAASEVTPTDSQQVSR